MRVALFTDSDSLAGTERHILELARGLNACGAEVKIACPIPSMLHDEGAKIGLEVLNIQKGAAIDAPAIIKVRRLLKRGEIDIVHSHNGRCAFAAAAATCVAGRGVCVTTQHFLEPNRVRRRGLRSLVSRIAHTWTGRKTAQFVSISEAVRNRMLERNDAPVGKISVIVNGIADPREQLSSSSFGIRKELGIMEDTIVVVCAARLEPEKNVSSLISAMGLVCSVFPSALCLIAGKGSLEKTLRDQINHMGLAQNVRLLGFRSDILACVNAGDIFVLPSLAEPFGLVILEAMGLAKPVVATDAGGPKEIVIPGQTGRLVAPCSIDLLASAIIDLIARPHERIQFGTEGRKRFETYFTANRMAERTMVVYRQAMHSPEA